MDKSIDFSVNSISEGHHRVSYRGVKYIKCPFDYVTYQMIITQLKPDLVIEVGTNAGGGALYIADLMNMNGRGMVHTIDIQNMVTSDLVRNHDRIKRFLGGYQSYDIKDAEGFEVVVVIDDGPHMYTDVRDSLEKFKNLPSIGSYFIVEDGIIDALGLKEYDGGPLRAIEEFLSKNPNYIVDRSWCDFFGRNATFNVNGFLKRIS